MGRELVAPLHALQDCLSAPCVNSGNSAPLAIPHAQVSSLVLQVPEYVLAGPCDVSGKQNLSTLAGVPIVSAGDSSRCARLGFSSCAECISAGSCRSLATYVGPGSYQIGQAGSVCALCALQALTPADTLLHSLLSEPRRSFIASTALPCLSVLHCEASFTLLLS